MMFISNILAETVCRSVTAKILALWNIFYHFRIFIISTFESEKFRVIDSTKASFRRLLKTFLFVRY